MLAYSHFITGSIVSRIAVVRSNGTQVHIIDPKVLVPKNADQVLVRTNKPSRGTASAYKWVKPLSAAITEDTAPQWKAQPSKVKNSWIGQFLFREEQQIDGNVVLKGLRPPQIGAVYGTLAHWRSSIEIEPGTIVMPTGTGKTETMLSLLVSQRLDRLLVVVPTSALRDQISEKFITLGLLQQLEVVTKRVLYPVVGIMEHRFSTPEQVAEYFSYSNVVVTTMQVVSGCSDEVQRAISRMCSHLFIDEAHHVSAPTWEKFRRFFDKKVILQFTATPFRNDGKPVPGKIVFNYPLGKAQKEGYFKTINFLPIKAYNPRTADQQLAEAAINQLDQDLGNKYDHILMARTSAVEQAKVIHQLYADLAPGHNPQIIYSELGATQKQAALEQLRTRRSRIIVCVDMLGEGFDLPQLKIAALHHMHKSLAITLQFTGRFTRTLSGIGDATVIANTANPEVEEALQELYAESADWNLLLKKLSENQTQKERSHSEFLADFDNFPDDIPLQNIFPKMSTVIYRTSCRNWHPEQVETVINETRIYIKPTVNHKQKVFLFVTREKVPVPWGDMKEIYNIIWDLYLVHWDEDQQLLFINSSNNDSLHEDLAKAIAGDDVQIIRGETVFRATYGINHMFLMNLGLNHSLSKAMQFTLYVGSDIRQGLSEAHLQGKIKSNLFARGYEGGDKTSIGCSYKGRLWSFKIAESLEDWVDWCQGVGSKVLDESISVEEILKYVIIPEQLTERPPLVPLTIEWTEELLTRIDESIKFDVLGDIKPLYEVGIEIVNYEREGPLRFRVFTDEKSVEYEVVFKQTTVEYVPLNASQTQIKVLVNRKPYTLSEWLQKEPPVIRFEDEAFLIYNMLAKIPRETRVAFDPARLEEWDWTGINIRKESQTPERFTDSIQYKVIQELMRADHDPLYEIVFDDDDAGEAADIVAIKRAGDRLQVHFFHCKFSESDNPGARLGDLYAVCGQAQRSVHWKGEVATLMDHMCRRAARLQERLGTEVDRFIRGDYDLLNEIKNESRFLIPEFKIWIVQPGFSRVKAESDHLELLGATELYLKETYQIELNVITSP